MKNFSAVNVVHGKTQLHEPVHDLNFGEKFSLGFLFSYVESQVSMFTILHDDYQDPLFDK